MTPTLAGLPAVVTGSSRGLGRAFALALADAGARVVVNGTGGERVDAVVSAIRDAGGIAVPCVGSVADDEFCRTLVATCVEQFEGIGLLINNAGTTRDRSLLRMTTDEFDEVVAVHLRGSWSCATAAARAMRGTGGRIVNVSSGAGLYGTFGQANYAAAKAAIIGMSRVMDLEWVRYGINVNVLAPVAQTDMTAVFTDGTGVAHQHRFPPPDTVAPVVVHLAGPAADHLHGQVISFDGTELSVWSHPVATATVRQDGGWSDDAFAAALSPDVAQWPHPDRWGAGVTPSISDGRSG